MPDVNSIVDWVFKNKSKLSRWVCIVQLVVGISLLIFSYSLGRVPFRLIRSGVKAEGRIVDYNLQNFGGSALYGSAPLKLKWMPVVEFQVGGQKFRFQDRFAAKYDVTPGRAEKPPVGYVQTLLYDPENPSVAMLESPSASRLPMQWIPWFPMGVMAIIVILAAFSGLMKASRQSEREER